MCAEQKPSPRAFFSNLTTPMLLGRKLSLLLRNNVLKIVTKKTCCGHAGEPGC